MKLQSTNYVHYITAIPQLQHPFTFGKGGTIGRTGTRKQRTRLTRIRT